MIRELSNRLFFISGCINYRQFIVFFVLFVVVMLGVHLKRSGWMNVVKADRKKHKHNDVKIPEHIPYTSNTLNGSTLPLASKESHNNLQSILSSDDSKQLHRGGTEHVFKTHVSRRDPNVILIGIGKTGTGTLLEYLKHHPSMQIISGLVKNAMHCYFKSSKYQEDNIWYRSQLPASKPAGIILDKCLYYLDPRHDDVPERVYKFNKSIKFLIMTREPVARVQSWYTQYVIIERAKGKAASTLENIVYKNGTKVVNELSRPIRRSCYSKAWLKWLDVFPREQFHIIDGGTFTKDPYLELRKLEIFLNITSYFKREMFSFNEDKGFYCRVDYKGEADCMGSGKGREHIQMSEDLRQRLSEYFENCNELLPKLAGKRFSWIS